MPQTSIRKYLHKLSHWYFDKRSLPYWGIFAIDCCIVLLSGFLARALNADIFTALRQAPQLFLAWGFYMLFFLFGFRVMRTYSGIIRYSSFVDLMRVAVANLIAITLIIVARHTLPMDTYFMGMPWKDLLITMILATVFMWLLRIVVKNLYDVYYVRFNARRVFIYGVKEGGIALAKSIRSTDSKYSVAGFISDDPTDMHHLLLGVKIYPKGGDLVHHMVSKGASILMVSPLKSEALREDQDFVDQLTEAGIRILMYGQSVEWDGKSDLTHTHLKEVEVEDLLPRNAIEIDLQAIAQQLQDKCILITGAAGSIGSEIVRQVATFRPSQLVLIDQAETPLHDIRLMMARQFPDVSTLTLTASICHATHMEAIFRKYRPQYVFHAAAYKHVPMMEDNPAEAILNNVRGTRIIADLAVRYRTHKFVMVSTDKAVNPTNVMGCSKRICEMYCQSLNEAQLTAQPDAAQRTQFVTTRFGNVLGSNGSVIPLFREQIKAGGPLTVTHPDIIRYFMLIPEACKLVLQAGVMGNGGEIFVFDMGKPVKIADLARRMIRLSGATHVQIQFTGLRDGEKLYEELLNKEENTKPSSHPKIKLADVRPLSYDEVAQQVEQLIAVTKQSYDSMEIVRHMKLMVPEFKSRNSVYESLDK